MPSFDTTSLQRLRESRDTAAQRQRADGTTTGQTWALETAEYEDLQRVARLQDSTGVIDDVPYALAKALLDDENPDARDASEEFEQVCGQPELSQDFAIGFIEGAAEVLAEV